MRGIFWSCRDAVVAITLHRIMEYTRYPVARNISPIVRRFAPRDQPVQSCGIFARVSRKDVETRVRLGGWVSGSFRARSRECTLNESVLVLLVYFSVLRPLFSRRAHNSRGEHTHTVLYCYSFKNHDCGDNCGAAFFASRIKSRVITGSGDRIRRRGFEGQVTREREERRKSRREMGRGCYAGCIVSELGATRHRATDDALRNISKAYRRAACPREAYDVRALRAVRSYLAEFNAICSRSRSKTNFISCLSCTDTFLFCCLRRFF